MSWLTAFLTSTIGRKLIVALTGLFLCIFLVIHLLGNLQLIWGSAEGFNEYTYMMTHNKVIKIASYLTYASILIHALMAIAVTLKNRAARPQGYEKSKPGANSSWSSRNMAFLGVVLLVFVVVHLQNFWWKMKFGELDIVNGHKDMHTLVMQGFQVPWIVALYVIAMCALAYHLAHGFQSGFQTLGANHPKYTPVIRNVSTWLFGILIPLAFAAIPVYVFFAH